MAEKNTPPRNKDAEAGVKSNANDGGFASRRRTDAESGSVPARQRHAGVSAIGATVVESAVSDRDKNYWVAFDQTPANIRIKPIEAGLTDPEGPELTGHHKLVIRAENESELNVTYTNMPSNAEALQAAIADYGSSELEALEEHIRRDFAVTYGGKVIPKFRLHNMQIAGFEAGPRWDGVRVEFVDRLGSGDGVLDEDRFGNVSFYTSNLMARLEEDQGYRDVRNGAALEYILDVIEFYES